MADLRKETIASLLRELSEWRRLSGFDPTTDHGSPIRSTGETNAAIYSLRERLDALGVEYEWNERAQEYRLIDGKEL